jgi:hypothetical protein
LEIVEKKLLNLFFKISIAVGLMGPLMYLLQEMIASFQSQAYPVFTAIADIIGIFAIIAVILWLFLPKFKLILLNIIFLLGIGYVLFFIFANFFISEYFVSIPGWFTLEYFGRLSAVGISFIGMLLLTLLSIGLIVIFSLNFGKRDQFGIFEKFTIILWIIIIGIFDFTSNFYLRNVDTFASPLNTQLGITFLPATIEIILILFLAIILVLNFFVGISKKILNLLTLLLINTVFLTLTISTVNYIGFTLPSNVLIFSIFGNIFLIIGATSLLVCSFLVLKTKYPKSLAKRSPG